MKESFSQKKTDEPSPRGHLYPIILVYGFIRQVQGFFELFAM
ncbi:hypothetical protein B4135_2346 [Caldibacillus debilis]|uniref:Uncharacterized protein n=1 Tax=Caldibacillus debilis TaxID=301148 RepID=A0A150M1W9_9BACI|nr:hypothetical protein B4135_2346 [Caldibacillus debilis]